MTMSAPRPRRVAAAGVAAATALAALPILGLVGPAGAADPTAAGDVCADAPSGETFTDVSAGDPGQTEIDCLHAAGVTEGADDGTYAPNDTVTRRQMALFLTRSADQAAQGATDGGIIALSGGDGSTPFTDINDEDEEVRTAIDRLHDAGITEGVTETTFAPRATVTRRQMANFVVRLHEHLTGEPVPEASTDHFTDDDGDSGERALQALAEMGIFVGDGEGNVAPGAPITRRQMAFVVVRDLQRHHDNGRTAPLFTETTPPTTTPPTTTPPTTTPPTTIPTGPIVPDDADQTLIDVSGDVSEASPWVRVQTRDANGIAFDVRDALTVLWVQDGTVHDLTNPDGGDVLYLNPTEAPGTAIEIYYELTEGNWVMTTVTYDAKGDLATVNGQNILPDAAQTLIDVSGDVSEASPWARVQTRDANGIAFDVRDALTVLWVQDGTVHDLTNPDGGDVLYLNPTEAPGTAIEIYYELTEGNWVMTTVTYDAKGDLATINGLFLQA